MALKRAPYPLLRPGGSDRLRRPFPLLTAGLIAAGALMFFLFPAAGRRPGTFLSVEDLDVMNLALVTVASVWVHPNLAHLALHLGLLGYFGAGLERRLGEGRVLATVLLSSVLAALINLNRLLEQRASGEGLGPLICHPPIGFAGAVAGLMGLFVADHLTARRSRPAPFNRRAAIGSLLSALFALQGWEVGGETIVGWGGIIDRWALGSAFVGGLGVGIATAAVDGDLGCREIGPGEAQPASVGTDIRDRRPVGTTWTALKKKGAAEMRL